MVTYPYFASGYCISSLCKAGESDAIPGDAVAVRRVVVVNWQSELGQAEEHAPLPVMGDGGARRAISLNKIPGYAYLGEVCGGPSATSQAPPLTAMIKYHQISSPPLIAMIFDDVARAHTCQMTVDDVI